jgi:type I restriction enzyme S subunit
MSFPKYSEYKDSGIEWIGRIPSHWHCEPMKYSTEIYTGNSLNEEEKKKYESIDLDHHAYISSKDIDINTRSVDYENGLRIPSSTGLKVAPRNSFLLCIEGGSAGKKIALLNQDVCFVNKLCCFNDKSGNLYKYYFAQTKNFKDKFEMSLIGLIGGVSTSALQNFCVPVPTREEQISIEKFLNHETAKIDALIADQEKLIELLKEKRQAVVSHAVTKGLNPNVNLKESGIEWLGAVPGHWDVLPLKRFFRLIVDLAPDDNNFELLSLYTDIGVRPRRELEARGNRASTTDGYFKVSKGDIVVNKLLAWMGAIAVSEYDGVTSPAYDILRAKRPLSPHYYDLLFRCGILNTEFRKYSRGIMDMRLRLYFEEFGQFLMPFPPYEEQLEIVEDLRNKLRQFDELSDQAQKAIGLLHERRSALISAAVMGQIDVRNMEAA